MKKLWLWVFGGLGVWVFLVFSVFWCFGVLVVCCFGVLFFWCFVFLFFGIVQSSLVSKQDELDFGCTETTDFADRVKGLGGMVCHDPYMYMYIYTIYICVYIHRYIYIYICTHISLTSGHTYTTYHEKKPSSLRALVNTTGTSKSHGS